MEIHDEDAVIVYTDGSMFSKPRRQGGIGIRLIWTNPEGEEEFYDHSPPGYYDVSVPLMELKAVIEALRLLARQSPLVPPELYSKIVVYSDAMYMVDGHPAAKGFWPRNKWMTRDGPPVKNAKEWKELLRLERRIGKRFEIRKVEGHGKNPHNKAVDKLARASAKAASNPSIAPAKLRRKKSPKRLIPGSVKMEGQRITIHVHKGQYEPVQRLNAYRYSVESPSSPYYQEVGWVFAERDIHLNAGHAYAVRFNEDTKNPRIEEVFMEVVDGGAADLDDALTLEANQRL
jgi:ribonuclease HI